MGGGNLTKGPIIICNHGIKITNFSIFININPIVESSGSDGQVQHPDATRCKLNNPCKTNLM